MAEQTKAGQKFFKVRFIEIFPGGGVYLVPHVGPEGYIGYEVMVRASEVRCFGPVEHVLRSREGVTRISMPEPTTCVLMDDVLICGLE